MFCKRCGARLQQGMLVCGECGTRQGRRASAYRCAHCGGRIAVGMAMCPHCGRNARPAGPRWGLWLGGAVALILLSLWSLGRLPLERLRIEVADTRAQLAGLAEGLVEPLPPAPAPGGSPTRTATPQNVAAAPRLTPGDSAAAVPSATLSAPPAPTGRPTAAASSTAAPSVTVAPTATVTRPAPTPTATATAAATATARPGAATTYRVQSGDSLASIGLRFDVAWESIAAANGLTGASILNLGQELIIPGAGAPLPPTATPRPLPTFTPAPTVRPTPALAAPVLTNPGNNTPYQDSSAFIELVWEPVAGGPAGMVYQVAVRYAKGGAPSEYTWRTTSTSARLPLWLWGQADQPARQYTWFVTAVQVSTDGKGGELIIPLSPPSATRLLSWN